MDGDEPVLDEEDFEEIIEDLEELEAAEDSTEHRRTLRRTRRVVDHLAQRRIFGVDDVAQQIVGGFILSAPFVVTEEVWSLAATMNGLQWAITVVMVFGIGYGALYETTEDQDPEAEARVAGVVPIRYLSLLFVAYASVTILALVFNAPETFGHSVLTTAKAVSIGAVFSVVGAATADSLFG